uniref:Uncharacterized protein n=1 Tax=Capra hircus TaxID=9925 RepID=A0A452G0A4_CAPHI
MGLLGGCDEGLPPPGKILRLFSPVFLSVFSVSSFAQTCEHRRADGFQTGTRP